jgi:hypothetical protein
MFQKKILSTLLIRSIYLDEIFKHLPTPIPKVFDRFMNSTQCDRFLQSAVKYIKLFLKHQKARVAAESKVGIDQLRR